MSKKTVCVRLRGSAAQIEATAVDVFAVTVDVSQADELSRLAEKTLDRFAMTFHLLYELIAGVKETQAVIICLS